MSRARVIAPPHQRGSHRCRAKCRRAPCLVHLSRHSKHLLHALNSSGSERTFETGKQERRDPQKKSTCLIVIYSVAYRNPVRPVSPWALTARFFSRRKSADQPDSKWTASPDPRLGSGPLICTLAHGLVYHWTDAKCLHLAARLEQSRVTDPPTTDPRDITKLPRTRDTQARTLSISWSNIGCGTEPVCRLDAWRILETDAASGDHHADGQSNRPGSFEPSAQHGGGLGG